MAANPDAERYDVLAQSERTCAMQIRLAMGRGVTGTRLWLYCQHGFAFYFPRNRCTRRARSARAGPDLRMRRGEGQRRKVFCVACGFLQARRQHVDRGYGWVAAAIAGRLVALPVEVRYHAIWQSRPGL